MGFICLKGVELENKDTQQDEKRMISQFGIISCQIFTRLIMNDNVDENIIEKLRRLEMEYDSILKKNGILEERVNIDDKTSLLKYNEDFLVNIIKTASRYVENKRDDIMDISYLRVDLDDFSKINNRYGHDVGDEVLVTVSKVMKEASRPTDYLFRFGGEEFDIVLPSTPLKGAIVYVEKLLARFRDISVACKQDKVKVSASIGISHFEVDLSDCKEHIDINADVIEYYHKAQKEADNACYKVKLDGKDDYSVYNSTIDYDLVRKTYSAS